MAPSKGQPLDRNQTSVIRRMLEHQWFAVVVGPVSYTHLRAHET